MEFLPPRNALARARNYFTLFLISAKPSKYRAAQPASPPPTPTPAGPAENAGGPVASDAPTVSWLDSNDPRRRLIGRIILVGVWMYVAALWLLALDQTFHWGIF